MRARNQKFKQKVKLTEPILVQMLFSQKFEITEVLG